jgi:hypothetical protein
MGHPMSARAILRELLSGARNEIAAALVERLGGEPAGHVANVERDMRTLRGTASRLAETLGAARLSGSWDGVEIEAPGPLEDLAAEIRHLARARAGAERGVVALEGKVDGWRDRFEAAEAKIAELRAEAEQGGEAVCYLVQRDPGAKLFWTREEAEAVATREWPVQPLFLAAPRAEQPAAPSSDGELFGVTFVKDHRRKFAGPLFSSHAAAAAFASTVVDDGVEVVRLVPVAGSEGG